MEALKKYGPLAPKEVDQDLAYTSPLAKPLLEVPFPSKFKIPQLESYDGSTNPRSHLAKFCTMMHLHTTIDALLCKVFPITLQDVAQEWYLGLEEGSIKSFTQLAPLFKARFVTSIPTKIVSVDL